MSTKEEALSDVDSKDCTKLFEKYDADKSGTLTMKEILPMVGDLGWEPEMTTEESVKAWFSGTDVDKGITKDQFLKAYGQNNLKDRRLAHMQRTFKKVDTDNSGSISAEEFKEAVQEASFFGIPLEDCEQLIKEEFGGDKIVIVDFIKYFKDSQWF